MYFKWRIKINIYSKPLGYRKVFLQIYCVERCKHMFLLWVISNATLNQTAAVPLWIPKLHKRPRLDFKHTENCNRWVPNLNLKSHPCAKREQAFVACHFKLWVKPFYLAKLNISAAGIDDLALKMSFRFGPYKFTCSWQGRSKQNAAENATFHLNSRFVVFHRFSIANNKSVPARWINYSRWIQISQHSTMERFKTWKGAPDFRWWQTQTRLSGIVSDLQQ